MGVAALLFGMLVNGCRINKLLGRSSTDAALLVSPGEVRDSALFGANAPRRATLLVANSGTWSATDDSPWIGITPSSGSGRRAVTVALDPQELQAGTHEGSVTVRTAVEPPVVVPVTFIIQQPILVVEPREVNRTVRSGSSTSEVLEVRNGGSGPLVWTASNSSSWLILGTVAGVGDGTIALTLSASGLSEGTYRDTVVIVAVGADRSPAKIPVTMRRRR